MQGEPLTEREHHVLDAVIRTYVETAEPAGSRMLTRRFQLGVSPATVRNTMSDLEEKGYLYHPHTSAGRIPTDRAYRFFVDSLIGAPRLSEVELASIRQELEAGADRAGVERLVGRAAQVLGLLTQELGIAVAPRLDAATLERLELIPVTGGKVLLVLALRAGRVRTIYVDVPSTVPASALASVARILNERLAGHTLREIRATLPERLRDTVAAGDPASELLNIFLQSREEWFDSPGDAAADLHLGRASVLADQPEFASGERMRGLIELIEHRDLLKSVLGDRVGSHPLQVTIGEEHGTPALAGFTVVTSEYHVGDLKGVIGVIGPTRMPYDRVIAFVEKTSTLVSEFLA
ncbi:MAG TPA: heat-inducible transcriptional repressor HrcA [Longimicrobiaceae bacterium]|nr:heat-inducible transcriptional repressor HrcA [Longimicrobiaceae bacterium]